MPGEVVAQEAAPEPAQNAGFVGQLKSLATRILFMYLISYAIRSFMGQNQQQAVKPGSGVVAPAGKVFSPAHNLFHNGEIYDFYMYLSSSNDKFSEFNNSDTLFWSKKGLRYGDWSSGENGDGSYMKSVSMPTPDCLLHNQSLYLHTFVTKQHRSPNPKDRNYNKREVSYGSIQLNKYKKRHYKLTSNLLTGETELSEYERKKAMENVKFEVLNYWHPNLTVNLVTDFTAWTQGQIPAPLDKQIKFDLVDNYYYPVIFFNNYWNLNSEYVTINESLTTLNFTVVFSPLSLFKWQLYASQQTQGEWTKLLNGGNDDEEGGDQDVLKQALIETNPVLLGVTVVVSILHTIMEFLAFKNDIQFWKTRKSLEGLSVRSVLFNIFQSLIVFLYICDNDASWVVKGSVFFGLLIEFWKVPKCLDVKIDYEK